MATGSTPTEGSLPDDAKKLLLVEDDAPLRGALTSALSDAGFRVAAAESLSMAKHLLSTQSPVLVILDIQLPDGSGLDFCRELRSHKDHARLPVILLTGKGELDDKSTGFEAGADQYLVKPVLPREAVLWVQALLKRVELEQGGFGVLKAGDLEIDPKSFLARYKGQPLPRLTVKEFELLYFLVRKRPQVFSRKYILSRLWHTITVDHVVNYHVMNLRRKLPPEIADRIQSVPGKGFRYFQ